jgi:uncharacterized protein (TIGR02145 family)
MESLIKKWGSCLFRYLSMILIIWFTNSCGKDYPPILKTNDISELSATSVVCGGNITSDEGARIKSRGVCWSTEKLPTLENNITIDGKGTGSFNSSITGLTPNTKYYLRAYATNRKGTSYGNQIEFATYDGSMSDQDNNVYPYVKIGTQVWLATNLKVTHFNNGDPIPLCTGDDIEWQNLTTAAYCGPIIATYGALYNWYAVNDSRGIAPAGWHVASDNEWMTLINYCGGQTIAALKLKEAGVAHWGLETNGQYDPRENETRFTALPGGYRFNIGGSYMISEVGYWWTSSEYDQSHAHYYLMYNASSFVDRDYTCKFAGMSVRCVKD